MKLYPDQIVSIPSAPAAPMASTIVSRKNICRPIVLSMRHWRRLSGSVGSSPLPRTDPLPNSLLKTELVLLLVFLHALPCHYGGHISKSQLLANDYSNDYKVTNGHEILSIVATSPMCVDQVLIENHSTLTQNMQNGSGNVFFRHSRVSAEHRGRTKPKLSESQSL